MANIKYYDKPSVVVEKIDARMESLAKPIARMKYSMTMPTGLRAIAGKIDQFNCDVEQITVQIPAIGGATTRVAIYDEIGAELYLSNAISDAGTYALKPSSAVHLAGLSTLTVTISAAQVAPVVIYVMIYGK